MDVVWKDDTHIEVSSTDELDKQNDISTQYDHCNDIEVVYHFKFAPPPLDEAPDDETAAAISSAISQMQTCIDSGSNSKRSDELKSLMNKREHGDALEWLCTYLKQEHCPISQNVLAQIQQAAAKMRRTKMSCYQLEQQAAP